MVEKPFRKNINERRLVEFGLVYGLLKRLHKYPIYKNPVGNKPPEILLPYINRNVLGGQHSFDDICVALDFKLEKVQYDLEFNREFIVIIQKLGV